MAAVGQTITIVNKSGKIVSSSKHLVNVFKEAKSAYNERKAEIKAERKEEYDLKNEERRAHRHLEALTLEDPDNGAISRACSRRSSRRGESTGQTKARTTRSSRPPLERGVSDSFYTNDHCDREAQPSPLRHEPICSHDDNEPRLGELSRRRTDMHLQQRRPHETSRRRASYDDIDMDLAYGELPPPLPGRKYTDEVELRSKMSNLQTLLDELNCVQHSAVAMIDNLQKNPEALAAVALTLGEISNLAAKLAPGALLSMKGVFPMVFALLCSPQFAIAAGVGVGVTIIAFGGYKIVKKIQARRALESGIVYDNNSQAALPDPEDNSLEMDELRELSRVEQWRRGVAQTELESPDASVEGEFVTPQATRTLIEEGRLTKADLKSTVSSKSSRKKKSTKTERPSSSDRKSKASSSTTKGKNGKKEPSGLRMLFKTHA